MAQMALTTIKAQFIYHAVAKELYPNSTIDPHSITSLCNASNMSDFSQDAIQKRSAYYTLAFQLTSGLPNMLGSFLVGSLSDSFGRRLGLGLPTLGQSLACTATAVFIILDIPLYYFFITEFCYGISGNVFPVAAAYLADATTEASRTFRLSVLDITLLVTIGLGSFAYNEWLQAAGGIKSFMFAPILTFLALALVYIIGFLQETKVDNAAAQSRRARPTAWESIKRCDDVFRVPTTDSSSLTPSASPRKKLNVPFILLFLAFLFAQFAQSGTTIEGLYLMNHPLCWEPRQLGTFILVTLIVLSLGTLIATKWLVKLPRIGGDMFLLFLSFTSGLMAYIVMAFLRHAWMVWLYISLGAFKITGFPVLRSMMSRTVSPAAFGSLFACVSVIESAASLVVAAFFSFVYAQTLDWFPGFIFLLISATFGVSLVIVVVFKGLGFDKGSGGYGGAGGGGNGRGNVNGGRVNRVDHHCGE